MYKNVEEKLEIFFGENRRWKSIELIDGHRLVRPNQKFKKCYNNLILPLVLTYSEYFKELAIICQICGSK